MKSSQRLKPVQRLNEFQEKNAARELGQHTQKLIMHRKRLEDLLLYRDEYNNQFLAQGQNGVSAVKLQDFQAFMKNLAHAIEQQEALVAQHEQENDQLKRQWMATHRRSQAIDNVVERKVEEEKRVDERRDQREIDDRPKVVKP